MTGNTAFSRNKVVTAMRQAMRHADGMDGWLYVVSVEDWIMSLPQDPDYISPFRMQACLFEEQDP